MDKQTPLNQRHKLLNAKMVSFGGWEMPLQYTGILDEYEDARRRVTVFDTSHMGEFFIEGDPRAIGLDGLISSAFSDIPVKSCRYGLLLNEHGGARDDLVVYRRAEKSWMLVVNAATTDADAGYIRAGLAEGAVFRDVSGETGKLDVQGPRSRDVLRVLAPGIEKLDYYTFDEFQALGHNVIISRTGYTGELGYEVYCPAEKLPEWWSRLLAAGVKPAGLGVRDVLRIEAGYALYGHELRDDLSVLESGADRFLDWNKDFVGKAALAEERTRPLRRKMACLLSHSRRSPRHGHSVWSASGDEIGVVTSGTFSPFFKRGVGLALVRPEAARPGEEIFFGDPDNRIPADIVSRPVYKKGSLKQ